MEEVLHLVKQSLGIVSSATAKDDYINMIIKAAMIDMNRVGINVDIKNDLIKNAIITYVKANFGISNPNKSPI